MELDALGRRPRWYTPSAEEQEEERRTLRLEPSDQELLRLYTRYRYLRPPQVAAFLDRSPKGITKRCGQLYRAGYLGRPLQYRKYANADFTSPPHELTPLGRKTVFDPDPHTIADLSQPRDGRAEFAHSVMVCDIMASIELGARAAALDLITWKEILADAPERAKPLDFPVTISEDGETVTAPLRPDAIFAINYPKGFTFYCLEADRDEEPVTRQTLKLSSYYKKLLQYQQFVGKGLYRKFLDIKRSGMIVLNASSNPGRITRFMVKEEIFPSYMAFTHFPTLGDITCSRCRQPDHTRAFCKNEEAPPLPIDFLFQKKWTRSGHADFTLTDGGFSE